MIQRRNNHEKEIAFDIGTGGSVLTRSALKKGAALGRRFTICLRGFYSVKGSLPSSFFARSSSTRLSYSVV